MKTRKAVEKMKEYDPPTQQRAGKLRLDFNENSIGCSPKVIERLQRLTGEDLSIYPSYNYLLEKISNYINSQTSQILTTNGTDEALKCFFDTFVEQGEEVILLSPSFAMFRVYADISGAKVKEVLYNKDLSFPVDELLNAITSETKVILIANPNNPTGTSITNDDLRRVLTKAENALVVVDEAYYDFYGKSAMSLLKEYKNLAVTRTFSKAFGLAAIRLGFIVSNDEVIKEMKKVLSPYSVNGIAINCSIAALDDLYFVNCYVDEVNKGKEILYKEFEKLNIKFIKGDANFFIANFGEDCNRIYNELKKRNILVRNRSKYPLLKGCLRIGVGTLQQTQQFLDVLKEILEKDALLFDMDGVLVDVNNSYRTAVKKTAEFFTNSKVSNSEIQEFKEKIGYNNDWDLTEAIIIKREKKIEKQKIIDKFQEIYFQVRDNEKWLLDKGILNELKKKFKLGIVTGRPREEALYVLNKNNAKQFFEVIITLEDVGDKPKPNPYGILKAMKQLDVNKAIYFGDAIDDIIAAKNAGINGIGVLSPNCQSNLLSELMKENGASMILNDINQITKVVK